MNTNQDDSLLLKNEVYQIVGSANEVLNEIGHSLEPGKLLSYLMITKLQVGEFLNFKNATLKWERIVH